MLRLPLSNSRLSNPVITAAPLAVMVARPEMPEALGDDLGDKRDRRKLEWVQQQHEWRLFKWRQQLRRRRVCCSKRVCVRDGSACL